jgi:hypothetical protein
MRHDRHHRKTSQQLLVDEQQSSFKKSSTEKTLKPGGKNEQFHSLSVEVLNHKLSRNGGDNDGRGRLCTDSDNGGSSFNKSHLEDDDNDDWSNRGSSPWQSFVHHERLKGQTSDPDALRWDKAVDSFRWGVQRVRDGRVLEGAMAICTSILMDTRAYKACRRLPLPSHNGNDEDNEKPQARAAEDCLLDESVAQTLQEHNKDHVIVQICAFMIVAMRTEQWKASSHQHATSSTTRYSQQEQILRMITATKNILAQRPNIAEVVDNGDAWSMDHWHYFWAMRYLAVNRDVYWHKAYIELKRALEHNPSHTRARYHAALLCSQYDNDNDNYHNETRLYNKWKDYIQVAHVDDYYLHDAYTWMAYLVVQKLSNGDDDTSSSDSFSSRSSTSSLSSSSIIDDNDESDQGSAHDDETNTTTTTAADPFLVFQASHYLQASDAAFRRHVELYNFVECQPKHMFWYSSNHYDHAKNTTTAKIMKKKATIIARLRSHPDQKTCVKYWTVAPPPPLPL